MTLPLNPNAAIGESEFSWGPGMFPHPDSNFQGGKLPFPEDAPIDDGYKQLVAQRRSDPTVADETDRDLLFAKGNPDRFGGQPALVQTEANVAPTERETVTLKERVERED